MELFFSYHKEPRGKRLLEMAQQLNNARVGISEMHLAFDMLLDFIFAFCFLVTRWLLTALDMAHMLKAGKSRNRGNGEPAPTLPFSPFNQGSRAFPEPFRRLPCRCNWPMYMKNELRVPDELWNRVHDIVQETGIKTIPMEKKCKKAKWLSGEALEIAVKRKDTSIWMQSSKE